MQRQVWLLPLVIAVVAVGAILGAYSVQARTARVPALAGGTTPTSTLFMTVEGASQGPIEGSSTVSGREGMIVVNGLSHEVATPRDPASGMPTGRRVHHPLIVTKAMDKASPKLYQALTSGERLHVVELRFYRAGQFGAQEHYFTTRLEDAQIVSIKARAPGTGSQAAHTEHVSFTYRRIVWRWEPGGIESEDSWRAGR